MTDKKKVVNLVGMAHTTRDLAKWEDPDVEIWTLNESPARRFGYVKRVTRHFQLHPKWNYDRDSNQNDPEHADWLRAQKDFPIYMQEVDPDIPMSVKYPLREICEFFQIDPDGPDHFKEFTSTFPYMLALAMYEEFDRIEIYGFEMGSETEYAFQRSSAHLWLGRARERFLLTGKPELYIPDGSRLLGYGSEMYAFDMILNLNPMEIEIDRNKFAASEKELLGRISEIQGTQDELQNVLRNLSNEYNEKIKAIQTKKMDEKLKQRRIKQKMEEHQAKAAPTQQRLRELDNEKLNVSQKLNYVKGMKDYAVMSLARYHEQLARVTGPEHGVQLKT